VGTDLRLLECNGESKELYQDDSSYEVGKNSKGKAIFCTRVQENIGKNSPLRKNVHPQKGKCKCCEKILHQGERTLNAP